MSPLDKITKDKSFVRVHSMASSLDISTLMKEVELKDDKESKVEIRTEEITDSPKLPKWPAEPVPLAVDPVVEYAMDAYDITLVMVPVLLIVKAVLCIVAARKDRNASGPLVDQVSSMTLNLIKFNSQLVTIFTIVFVMIMAALARRIALWKAQRGATVGELEQFQNSTSLEGTIKTIWSLRAFSFTSVALILAWAWYYLGSQASTREYLYRNSDEFSNLPIALHSATGLSYFKADSELSAVTNVQLENINAEFTQDCVAQTDKPYDRNGAAVVPLFGQTMSFPPYLHQVDKDGWQHTSEYSTTVYSSFVGSIPWGSPISIGSGQVATMSYHLLGDYTFITSYLIANCTSPTYVDASEFPAGVLETITLSFNMTKSHYIHTISARPFDLWNRYNATIAFHSTCKLYTANVEVGVSCSPNGCTATKIRPSRTTDFISNRTPFDSDNFAYNFFNNLTLSSGVPSSINDTTVLSYALYGLTNFRENFENLFEFLYTGDRPQGYASDLTRGMTQVINTYFAISQPHSSAPDASVVDGSETDPNYITTTIHGAPYLPQYALSVPWLVVDFISNTILLFAAIASFILRHRTLAPDIFGYVSSLTRDNPHFNLPDGGSTMTGLQRARSMKHVKVKIGNVNRKNGEVGPVGLTTVAAGGSDLELDKLEKGRQSV